MPIWDDLLNCVCQNAPQRPEVQELLDALQRNTVCTGTQCFETEADAYGLTAAPNTVQPNTMFFMMIMCTPPPMPLACTPSPPHHHTHASSREMQYSGSEELHSPGRVTTPTGRVKDTSVPSLMECWQRR